jgi:hypothetical protein
MPRVRTVLTTLVLLALLARLPLAAEGIVGDVLRVDHQKQCLWVDWHNNTEKIACWTAATKFSVLETGEAASPADVRKGSYVRMQGEEKDGTYWATEIVIWQAASKPAAR